MGYLRYLGDVYKKITNSRKRQGSYKKCEFHLHTPASYDYRLIESDSAYYKDLTTQEVMEFAVEQELIPIEFKERIDDEIQQYHPNGLIPATEGSTFTCLKEEIAYELIVNKLFISKVEIVVISDHNTISGFKKLKYARESYSKRCKQGHGYLDIILGVEISCSERNHVIGMFDCNQETLLSNLLEELIVSEKEGTYHTSLYVLEEIRNKGGIGYIAHVNSINWWSGAYNKRLLNSDALSIIGFSNFESKKARLQDIKKQGCSKEFCIIAEGDSHSVNQIGKNNVWIKLSKINFSALGRAFSDYRVCISNVEPQKSDKYIKGIYIVPGESGFLTNLPRKINEDDELSLDFHVGFSRDLNCIIGGRGTGKSTLLNVIEAVFNWEFTETNEFNYICRHNIIYVVFSCEGSDYILMFLPQVDDNKELLNKAIYIDYDGKKMMSKEWFQLYRVKDEDCFEKIEINEASKLIQTTFYRRGYSINKLVSQIGNGNIGLFIKNTVLFGLNKPMQKYLDEVESLHRQGKYIRYLADNFSQMERAFKEQKNTVTEIINKFNEQYVDTLKVIYSPKEKNTDYYLDGILKFIFKGSESLTIKKNEKKIGTYVSRNNAGLFVKRISEKMGYLYFLQCLFKRKYSEIEKYDSILHYADIEKTYQTVQKEYVELDNDNIKLVYGCIYNFLSDESNKHELLGSIEKYFEVVDDFTILFNVNKKESLCSENTLLRPIEDLSLGQKVVALLTFVFEYGNFIEDNTPLILDQPEDNLDNQYIFKNLVEALRKIKNKRQVIIVTHSSTIVTNADAEQIIVMESDNEKGWITSTGYTTDRKIVKHIMNHLEGGVGSFKNKLDKYKHYIKELTNE